MVKRIDLFMPPLSQYGVLHYMTKDIYNALIRAGVNCRLLVADHDDPEPFLQSLFNNPPECTLSFNGLLPDAKGRFFCEMIKIPHIACLVDSPNQFAALAQCKLNIITCPDLYACEFFRGLKVENVLFLPHGVGKDTEPSKDKNKKYDVVMLASCIDYENIRDQWKGKYSKDVCAILNLAAEKSAADFSLPYVEAFVQAMNELLPKSPSIDPSTFNLMQLLDDLEMYLRGKERVELVRGIKNAKIDLFGAGWDNEKYFRKKNSNIVMHDPVHYEEALEIMKRSKIVLNSCPWIKNGGHERIFAGMACGAVVITNENPFMKEHFKDGEDICYYNHGKFDGLDGIIATYLSDDAKREKVAASGRKKVMQGHTWDHRVAALLKQLPGCLELIKKSAK